MSRFITLFILSVLLGFTFQPVLAAGDILPPQPTEFTPIAPESGKAMMTSAEYVKRFQWEAIDHAVWYHLVILKGDQIQFEKWYQASVVCADGVCTSTDDIWLAGPGEYTWWMTHWNESIGGGYIHLYKKSTFSINFPLPQPPISANSPSGNITDTTPNLNWHNGAHAMWYHVLIVPADYSSIAYEGWHERTAVCSSELDLCGVVTPNALPLGDYEFWMQSWNPAGASAWVKMSEFSVALGGIVIKS